MFKKILSLTVIAVFALALLTSCAGGEEGVTTLYVYNWGEYTSDGSEGSLDSNAAFEEYCKTELGKNVKVNYSTYASNEDLYSKLSSGAVSYDVITPSDYMVARLAAEDLIMKIDPEKNIENYKYIDDNFKNLYYDENNEYSVPYTYGTVGVIYNTTMIDENEPDIGSWALMWNEKYSGSILQFNNPRDAFGTAHFYLGTSVNSKNEADWKAAQELLKKQKSVVQGYVMDEVFNKMESGSAAAAPYYAGDFFTMYEENEDLAFFYPKEGTNVFVDAMCVPKNSQNSELALEYINFMLSEEIAIANAEAICYASPNKLVYENEDYQADMTEIHEDAMEILYHFDIDKAEYFHDLPDDIRNLQNDLWEELKIESTIGGTVYIICGIIVVILAALIVIRVITKKKKESMM